jgi:hypothetical protein
MEAGKIFKSQNIFGIYPQLPWLNTQLAGEILQNRQFFQECAVF